VGICIALATKGAYDWWAQIVVGMVLAAAVLVLPRAPWVGRADLPVLFTAAGFAGWALIDGFHSGRPAEGGKYALIVTASVALACVCRSLGASAKAGLTTWLLLAAGVVAALGWFGVVAHHPTLGFESPGLWRASSTLTYPNATAAVLAMCALTAIGVRVRRPDSRWLDVMITVLLTGMVATLSRAGVAGFAAGAVVLAAVIGWRPVLRAAAAPMAGAVVAVGGLLPSITVDDPTTLTVTAAAAGVLAGAAIAWWSRLAWLVPVAVAGALVAGLPLTAFSERFSVESPDRWAAIRAAWQVFLDHPAMGAGPGLDRLTAVRGDGIAVFRYAHNEYVQVLAELGVVGGVLLAAFLIAVFLRAGGAAAPVLAALAVHAGFDFVWHIPVIPLLAAVLVATTTDFLSTDRGTEWKRT